MFELKKSIRTSRGNSQMDKSAIPITCSKSIPRNLLLKAVTVLVNVLSSEGSFAQRNGP